MKTYQEFLEAKILRTGNSGFHIDKAEIHPSAFPHQSDIIQWAALGGRRAIFASFGLGKSMMQLELMRLCLKQHPGRGLIICPLGVRQEFRKEADRLGMQIHYVRTTEEVLNCPGSFMITNYERVRDGGIDVNLFTFVSLDEASILRSFGSKTYQTFLDLFVSVPFRYVCTATPSPNRYKELIHYAGFLGVMDTGQALTRFFKRDSTKANNLTLYEHKEREFWLWVSSWAIFITKPSDLGYSDEGYDLPPLNVHYHMVNINKTETITDSWGQVKAFRDPVLDLKSASKEKRESIEVRVGKIMEIVRGKSADSKINCKSEVLPGEQRAREKEVFGVLPHEQRHDRSGQEKRIYEGISEDVRTQEIDSGTEGGKESAQAAAICNRPSTSREDQTSVAGNKHEASGQEKEREAQVRVRDNAGGISGDIEGAGRCLCDLREDNDRSSGEGEAGACPVCGPLSQNWSGSGSSMQPLQFRNRTLQGQPGTAHEGSGLSDQIIIWCDLNEEQNKIERCLRSNGISVSSLYGSGDIDDREDQLMEWRERLTSIFLSKPVMYGSGINMQQSHTMIFSGISYKFADFIQAVHRTHRFQQQFPVDVHIIYTENEENVMQVLQEKWQRHDELVSKMTDIIKEFGLSHRSMFDELKRTIGLERREVKGELFTAVNNDCVLESASMETDSIDLIHTSIPFSNHYEYTPSYNDFGHTNDNGHFWAQMDYLTPELLRILRPGRIYACHVKDRILFGNVTGAGVPTVSPFHAEAIFHGAKHGFDYMGMITIVTDVVRENNQTYRLGWTENCKDGTKMGVGSPEYVLLFRKPQTDRSRGYADMPVTKSKDDYGRAQWQIDAHAFWRSSGNRLLTPEEIVNMDITAVSEWYRNYSKCNIYNYQEHVGTGKALEPHGYLPSSFMLFQPQSHNEEVWTDVNRMRTLNMEQSRNRQQAHVCPLQFDIVERIINRYTNPGELVYDPFGGLMTVPYCAIKLGRRGYGCELSEDYFKFGVEYCRDAENERLTPSLFDCLEEVA